MSPKQWLALFCFYLSYLFFGASVFYHFEHELETERRWSELQERIHINELLVEYTAPENKQLQDKILEEVSDYCGKAVTNHTTDEYIKPYVWNFYHSFFFSFIVCSTIGYGNISPHNTFGRMFLIFYALIGIPVNGFVFAYLGDFFGKTFIGIYRRYKTYKMATTKNYIPMRFTLIGRILLYLMPGIVLFIFLPSILFTYFEDWPYTVSIYYSVVTLTTVGFGDYVPTFQPHQEHVFGDYFVYYQIFIIFWFMFGLGYLVMILGFIAKGMRSKRIARLEHQLSENLKSTQNRIWHGVSKDVSYLRRILNEVYLMKFKPVYNDDDGISINTMPKSASCPDLTMYSSESPRIIRKRAYSEMHNQPLVDGVLENTITIGRVQSDTDLSRINKERTFQDNETILNTGNFLATVVTALGSIRPLEADHQSVLNMMDTGGTMSGNGGIGGGGGGIHGFSDSQILASEQTWSGWSLTQSDESYSPQVNRQRTRAASDFRAPSREYLPDSNEWTWSGTNNNQIQEFLRKKARNKKSSSLHRTAVASNSILQNKLDRSITINVPSREDYLAQQQQQQQQLQNPVQQQSLLSKINPFKKRERGSVDKIGNNEKSPIDIQELEAQRYLEKTAHGRHSRISLPRQQHLSVNPSRNNRRQSVFSVLSTADEVNNDILENTTLADLIRALEVVHTQVNGQNGGASGSGGTIGGMGMRNNLESPLLSDTLFDGPRRKMGIASLTPPKSQSPPHLLLPPMFGANLSRRSSLRPVPQYTTIFSSKNQPNMMRRQSSHVSTTGSGSISNSNDAIPWYLAGGRRPSLRPSQLSVNQTAPSPPPPYMAKESPKPMSRRFSVRPTNLSTPPGQAPPSPPPTLTAHQKQQTLPLLNILSPSTTALQRRLSLRPSPLARTSGQISGRFTRQLPHQTISTSGSAGGSVSSISGSTTNRLQIPGGGIGGGGGGSGGNTPPSRNLFLRSGHQQQINTTRSRHGSLSQLYEKNDRKRTESK